MSCGNLTDVARGCKYSSLHSLVLSTLEFALCKLFQRSDVTCNAKVLSNYWRFGKSLSYESGAVASLFPNPDLSSPPSPSLLPLLEPPRPLFPLPLRFPRPPLGPPLVSLESTAANLMSNGRTSFTRPDVLIFSSIICDKDQSNSFIISYSQSCQIKRT